MKHRKNQPTKAHRAFKFFWKLILLMYDDAVVSIFQILVSSRTNFNLKLQCNRPQPARSAILEATKHRKDWRLVGLYLYYVSYVWISVWGPNIDPKCNNKPSFHRTIPLFHCFVPFCCSGIQGTRTVFYWLKLRCFDWLPLCLLELENRISGRNVFFLPGSCHLSEKYFRVENITRTRNSARVETA